MVTVGRAAMTGRGPGTEAAASVQVPMRLSGTVRQPATESQ